MELTIKQKNKYFPSIDQIINEIINLLRTTKTRIRKKKSMSKKFETFEKDVDDVFNYYIHQLSNDFYYIHVNISKFPFKIYYNDFGRADLKYWPYAFNNLINNLTNQHKMSAISDTFYMIYIKLKQIISERYE